MSEAPIRVLQFIEGGARYGAAASLMNTAEGIRRRDVAVEFAVFAGKPLGDALRESGFKVHEIPARKRFDLRGIRALVRLLRSEPFDVLHTHLSKATVIGTFAARITRTPLVATVHGMNKKFTYMFADHVMTVSEAAKRFLVNQGMPGDRITPVYNCIRLDDFESMPDRADAKRAYGFESSAFVLGTVARAHKMKGIPVAIETVAELRRRGIDAKYLFVGDGPHLAEFHAQIDALGLGAHVRMPGFSDSILGPLAAMDAFIFPTHREAFGISLLEAMAARVPVIASSVDGVPEVLADGAGIQVSGHDPIAFADAAMQLPNAGIVAKARGRVECVFSSDAAAVHVEEVYQKAIQRSRSKSRNRIRQTA